MLIRFSILVSTYIHRLINTRVSVKITTDWLDPLEES